MTTEDLIKEIDDLIAANKPVSAIKRLRELFPEYNLKEAHDHIRFDHAYWLVRAGKSLSGTGELNDSQT